MFRVGDYVRWMLPLDHDYSYGIINRIEKSVALITETGGFYDGKQLEVHLRNIEKIKRGGISSGSNKTKKPK